MAKRNRIDHQDFETEDQLIDAVKKHFGVHTEIEKGEHQRGTIWLCGSTGKRIIGVTYFNAQSLESSGKSWCIGGQIWTPDFFV
jgi:hypothetical protein